MSARDSFAAWMEGVELEEQPKETKEEAAKSMREAAEAAVQAVKDAEQAIAAAKQVTDQYYPADYPAIMDGGEPYMPPAKPTTAEQFDEWLFAALGPVY